MAFICLASSDAGVPIEDVSRLVGHGSTSVTELATGISVPSSRVARRSWIGYSVRRATVTLPRLSPAPMGSRAKKAQVSAIAPWQR
jgi:hypothetical protein